MKTLTHRKSDLFFLTGSGLINTVVFSFILLSLTFITGHTLAGWHFPMAVFLSLLFNYFAAKHFLPEEYTGAFLRSTLVILIIIILSILIAVLFYDITTDGQMYHLETALLMKAGWNPFKNEIPLNYNQALWLNHYGKGVEAPQAALYALTNRIESTKATNFMVITGSFCLTMSYLSRLKWFSNRKNILFSILLAFNPVSFYQLLSTYVDGQLGSFLLCFIVVAGLIYMDADRYFLTLLASILILLINIKFTAIVFAAIFTLTMLFIFFINKRKASFKRAFFVSFFASVFAFGVVGYFPYVINIVRYHDVLYPGMKVLQFEAAKLSPGNFATSNRFSKFFTSFFSHTDELKIYIEKNPRIPPKIPFTINKTDVLNASKPFVVLMAGFGPFFSGICIVAFVLFFIAGRQHKDWKAWSPVLWMIAGILFSVFIISEAWYARYVPQLWFVPLALLMISEYDCRKSIVRIRYILYGIILLNISFCLASFPYVYYKSAQIRYELEQLKATRQIIPIQLTYYTSNRARFYENNIPYREDSIPDMNAAHMANSSTKLRIPAAMPNLPTPWIIKFGDKIYNRAHQ